MRRQSRFAPPILLATVLSAPLPALGEDASTAIAALEQELVDAIARTDLATYDRIVADDYVAYEASGKESTKAEIVASYSSGTRHYSDLKIFDLRARVYGDTAVVTARTEGFRREGQKEVPNRVRYIRVYARRGGTWRAVAQMATPMPPP
jgi:ketosteroid isomerase-like protein